MGILNPRFISILCKKLKKLIFDIFTHVLKKIGTKEKTIFTNHWIFEIFGFNDSLIFYFKKKLEQTIFDFEILKKSKLMFF
jgi:hypothetical protein